MGYSKAMGPTMSFDLCLTEEVGFEGAENLRVQILEAVEILEEYR